MNNKYGYWRGKIIDEMNREEILIALKDRIEAYDALSESMTTYMNYAKLKTKDKGVIEFIKDFFNPPPNNDEKLEKEIIFQKGEIDRLRIYSREMKDKIQFQKARIAELEAEVSRLSLK